MNNVITRILEKRLNKILSYYNKTDVDVPNILETLCRKYPNHKLKWYFLVSLKQLAIVCLWWYILWFVTQNCNAHVLCEPCIDMISGSGWNMTADGGIFFNNITNFSLKNVTIK